MQKYIVQVTCNELQAKKQGLQNDSQRYFVLNM